MHNCTHTVYLLVEFQFPLTTNPRNKWPMTGRGAVAGNKYQIRGSLRVTRIAEGWVLVSLTWRLSSRRAFCRAHWSNLVIRTRSLSLWAHITRKEASERLPVYDKWCISLFLKLFLAWVPSESYALNFMGDMERRCVERDVIYIKHTP